MSDLGSPVNGALTSQEAALFRRVAALIEEGQQIAAVQVDATMTVTAWRVGRTVRTEVLR